MENMPSKTAEEKKIFKIQIHKYAEKKGKEKTSHHQLMFGCFASFCRIRFVEVNYYSVSVQKQIVFYSDINTHFTL